MKFAEIRAHVGELPYISVNRAEILYEFIVEKKIRNVLELGIAHGTSSCYIAGALEEVGPGSELTCVDLKEVRETFVPSAEELLGSLGASTKVSIHREETSYTWYLKKKIEERTEDGICRPCFDFVVIDGCKNWTVDGAAFFLCDKLLNPGGWILFDDYGWTYASSGRDSTDGISHRRLGEDERTTPHVERIFKLLVMQHPDYSEFRVDDETWAWARKVRGERKKFTIDVGLSGRAMVLLALKRLGLVRK